MYRADTIVACATAAGRGAVALVRCSGRDALRIAGEVFRTPSGRSLVARTMHVGHVYAADGETVVDEAMAVYFPGPRSFTGEDVVEIHCHGSPVVVELVIASAISAGARAAERGEFTRRAVLNGKLDLLQAEAVADLVDARLTSGARAAWLQLQGSLSRQFDGIRSGIVSLLADVEASVDFSDDDLPDPDPGQRLDRIGQVISHLEEMLRGFPAAQRCREGLRVVFAGLPNAGKSSLINRLLGRPRMIVSDEAGTTRDTVEESVDVGGAAVVLVDTAGIRGGTGPAERLAVQRSREAIVSADLCVLVVDGALGWRSAEEELWTEIGACPAVVAWNKTDLGDKAGQGRLSELRAGGTRVFEVSALTGDGCAELELALRREAAAATEGGLSGISRVRHRVAVERALRSLVAAREMLAAERDTELASFEIRAGLDELAGITSPLGHEEVLDRIFSEFCLGK